MERLKRRLRPSFGAITGVALINYLLIPLVLRTLFHAFDFSSQAPLVQFHGIQSEGSDMMVAEIAPVASVGFALLWFWLVVTGRSHKGIAWGGAAIYGAIVAISSFAFILLIDGLKSGDFFLVLLLLVLMLVLVPKLTLCLVFFGVIVGLINGLMADWWVRNRYVGRKGR